MTQFTTGAQRANERVRPDMVDIASRLRDS